MPGGDMGGMPGFGDLNGMMGGMMGGMGGMGGMPGMGGMSGMRQSRSVDEIPPETQVVVYGLLSAPQHNGRQGMITSFVRDKGRYVVSLQSGESVSLKPDNFVQMASIEIIGIAKQPQLNGMK